MKKLPLGFGFQTFRFVPESIMSETIKYGYKYRIRVKSLPPKNCRPCEVIVIYLNSIFYIVGGFFKTTASVTKALRAGSSKSELAKISELRIQKICY